jgi:hypothetical protein
MADEFLSQTYDAAMRAYNAEMAEAQADFAKAQAAYDPVAAADATRKMSDIRIRAGEYHRMAAEHVAAQAAAPEPNPRNLTDEQMEHARVCGVSPEQYADNAIECERQGRYSWQNGMRR